ncbi:MAG: TolC family protein, partial [Planctomycetaceae bacterium]|nr:TolC family protein [Planctomycetaceae bacterium]
MRCAMAAALLLLAGCSGPDPRPLDPERSEAEFRSRRLDDPELLAWLEAQGVRRPAPWTLDSLTLAAFYFHPDLDVARARLVGVRAGETTAAEVPNPVLSANLEKVIGSAPFGTSPWVYGFNLQMPLDFLWKRGYRMDEARARSQGARLELAEAGWQARRRVRAALLEVVLRGREIELRTRDRALRGNASAAAALLLSTGEASRLEADRARIEETGSLLALEELRGTAQSARAALASAVGLPLAGLGTEAVEWPTLDAPPELPEGLQEAGLLNRLDVRRALAEYAAAEAVLGFELAKRYPDVTLGPGYLFDQGDRKFTIGLSVSLPIFNQNGGPIAEAEARRQESAARFLAIQAHAIGEF